MAFYETSQEKTYPPSRKKIAFAKKQGYVPYSRELAGSLSIIALTLLTYIWSMSVWESLKSNVRDLLENLSAFIPEDTIVEIVQKETYFIALFLTPIFLLFSFFLLFFYLLQTKGAMSLPFTFSTKRAYVIPGTLLLFKIFVVFFLIGLSLIFDLFLPSEDPKLFGKILLWIQLILGGYLVVAVIDYVLEKWRYDRSMWMTRQEVEEERKEGAKRNPILPKYSLASAIDKGTVIIYSATDQLAYILYFDPATQAPPICLYIAFGKEFKEVVLQAKKGGLSLIENASLTKNLQKKLKGIGSIPKDLYVSVAKALVNTFEKRFS